MKLAVLIALMIEEFYINPNTNEIYPMTGVVVNFDYEMNLVTVKDIGSEMCFQFYDIKDWEKGDVVSLLMANNETPEEWGDDIILDKQYTGVTIDTMEIILTSEDFPVLTCGD